MREFREFSMKAIMVATDFSGASYGAINYARHLATCFSAKILLVHVIDTTRSVLKTRQSVPGVAEQIDSAEAQLETIYSGLRHDCIRCAMIVRRGTIREVVRDLVEERTADLLVIGTRGQGYEHGEGLGSVAELLLRSVHCPVLTVGKYVKQDSYENTHPRSVLFPTDFSGISRAALAYTESLTHHLGGHLLMLHVDEKQQSEHKKEFEALITEMKNPSIVSEYITRVGHPADTIVAVSAEKRVDFIVMGVHGTDQATGESNYRIAFDVIRSAKCPVFTLFTQPKMGVTAAPEKEMTEAEEFHRQQERLSVPFMRRGLK